MTDENTQAAAPAEEPIVETPAVDLDAEPEKETEEGKADEAKPDEPKPDDEDEPEEKPKKLSGAQRAKIREARYQAEIESLRSQVQPRNDDPNNKPPKEEDFNGDFFAFQTAKTVFEVKQAIREESRQSAESRQQTLQQQEMMESAAEHAEREAEARKVLSDYDQVLGACPIPPSRAVAQEIISSEKSAQIAYFLGKNPEKLQAMNAMSARELAREVGRLEATVRLPSPKKQTSAPAPLSALKGGASQSSPDADLNAWLKKTYG